MSSAHELSRFFPHQRFSAIFTSDSFICGGECHRPCYLIGFLAIIAKRRDSLNASCQGKYRQTVKYVVLAD
jgi:hypothetical protein